MDIQLALKSKKIAELTHDEVRDRLRHVFVMVYSITGFKVPDKDDGKLLTVAMSNELKNFYGGLTMDEVSLCFEMGAKEHYGEFMGLNVRTFVKWLKAYKTSDMRYKAIQNVTAIALPPPSEEYNKVAMQKMAQRYFDDYKESGDFGDSAVMVYQFLQTEQIITQTPEYKRKIMAQIRSTLPIDKSKPIQNILHEDRVKLEAQRVCLKNYFQDLLDMDEDLKDMF